MFRHNAFETGTGAAEHFFALTIAPAESGCFHDEAEELLRLYAQTLEQYGCSENTEFLLRFHLSDITNQAPLLRNLLNGRKSFITLTGQPPADNCRLALEAWHIMPLRKRQTAEHSFLFDMENYRILLHEGNDPRTAGSYDQTREEFVSLEKELSGLGGNIADHTVRTWLYCRDVDNNYAGLVQARNHFFDVIGLTRDTHFIASTGIEGQSEIPSRLVTMDSLSIPGISPRQIKYLSAPEMLSPTAIYGVSFERGTRVVFGDRSHYYISGTASIDKHGNVLHTGDVRKQTVRLLDNVAALMESSEGSLADLRQATVYLRDLTDAAAVRRIIEERLPQGIPMVFLRAPVCRPTWLVEMEAIGINGKGSEAFPVFR